MKNNLIPSGARTSFLGNHFIHITFTQIPYEKNSLIKVCIKHYFHLKSHFAPKFISAASYSHSLKKIHSSKVFACIL